MVYVIRWIMRRKAFVLAFILIWALVGCGDENQMKPIKMGKVEEGRYRPEATTLDLESAIRGDRQ